MIEGIHPLARDPNLRRGEQNRKRNFEKVLLMDKIRLPHYN